MYEIDLETYTVSRSGWLFHPRPQRHCSVANERPKLHASILAVWAGASCKLPQAAPCYLQQSSATVRLQHRTLEGLQNRTCVTMPGLSLPWQHWSRPLQRNCTCTDNIPSKRHAILTTRIPHQCAARQTKPLGKLRTHMGQGLGKSPTSESLLSEGTGSKDSAA